MAEGIIAVFQNVKMHNTKLKTISNQINSLQVLAGESSGCKVFSDAAEKEELIKWM